MQQMFSSSYDYSNPFPNFPSSSNYPTSLPFLIDPENVHDFSNTLLDDPLSLPFIPSTTNTTHDSLPFHLQIQNEENVVTNLADCTQMFEQDHGSNSYASAVAVAVAAAASASANYGVNSIPNNYLTQKPAIAKKDRHSKIHTSQGLRDRRVRLSSEIARKFFDLQDMLEFDKPSNTLEWLFTKSENAIKELARSKNNNNNNNSCGTEKDEVVDSNNNNNKSLTTVYGGGGGGDCSKGRKLKWTQRGEDGLCVQSKKESRERARARARERTCYKRVQDHFEENTRCPAMLQQMMSSPPIQNVQPYPLSQLLLDSEIQRDHHGFNVIEESIMIKRNMMSSSQTHHHHHHHQQNLESFNNNIDNNNIDYPLLPYSTQNWDPNGFSSFCGIATMNLSTCFMNQWDTDL